MSKDDDVRELPRPPRHSLADIGAETVRTWRAGRYLAPSGRWVELADAVRLSVAGTWLFDGCAAPPPALRFDAGPLRPEPGTTRGPAGDVSVEVTGEASGEAVARLSLFDRRVGVLNFANAVTPGGGFLGGARAQEEQLCRCSTLYACLDSDTPPVHDFYARQRFEDSALALDLVLVSPGVLFFRDEQFEPRETPIECTVLTCAAPDLNWLHAQVESSIVPGETWQDVPTVIRRRARVIVDAAVKAGVDDLVLGAWGCGAFGNDPVVVADAFARALEGARFASVTFAIWGGPGKNRAAFNARFIAGGGAP